MNPLAYALSSSAIRRAQLVFVARIRLAVILGAATLLVALAGCGGSRGNGGGGSNPPTGATGRVVVNLIWPERNTRYIPVPTNFILLEVKKGTTVLKSTVEKRPAKANAVSVTIVVPAATGLLLTATAYEEDPDKVAPDPMKNNALATATTSSTFDVVANALSNLPDITMNSTIARLELSSHPQSNLNGQSRLVPVGPADNPTSYTLTLPKEAVMETAGELITVTAKDASGNTVMTDPEEILWGVTDEDTQIISIQKGIRRSGVNLVGNPVQVIGPGTTYSSTDNTNHPFTLTIKAPAEVTHGETQRTINVVITVLPTLQIKPGLTSTVTVGVNEVIPLDDLFVSGLFAKSYTKVSSLAGSVTGNTYTPTVAGDHVIKASLSTVPPVTVDITLRAVAPSVTFNGPGTVMVDKNERVRFDAIVTNLYNKAVDWTITNNTTGVSAAEWFPNSPQPGQASFQAPNTTSSFTIKATSAATFATGVTTKPSGTVNVTVR